VTCPFPFVLFAGTYKYFLEPQIVDIKVDLNGKKSSFSEPGIMDVQTESFTNPVTGEEQDTKIQLPKGFIFKLAEMATTKNRRYVFHLLLDNRSTTAVFSSSSSSSSVTEFRNSAA
jgi:hypothetical protein